MNPYTVISEFYAPGSELHRIMVRHGEQVAGKALDVARGLASESPDLAFIEEAALVHDIGIFMTRAPALGCRGAYPYVCHGYLGREILERKGLLRHARVCERHVGVGITLEEIVSRALPLPHRDMRPVTLEEEIVAYADKFFSKGRDAVEKRVPDILRGLERFGAGKAAVFRSWVARFEGEGRPDAIAPLPGS